MIKHLIKACVLTVGIFATHPLNAQSTDYSLSLPGWISGGNTGSTQTGNYTGNGIGVSTVTGNQTVKAGTVTWIMSPYTGSTMVGLQPGSNAATYSTMTSALGLSTASSTALSTEIAAQNLNGGGNITNAAWISKDFTFAAPTTFSMYWVYTSTDYVPFNDGSIATFVNTASATTFGKISGKSTQYLLLGATNPGTGNYSTGSYGSTGWQPVNYEVVTPGTYTVGFAAFNQGDTALSPVLFVNDGDGTVTKNGQPFNSVASNDPTLPSNNTSSGPTVVSTVSTTPTVTQNTTYGTPVKSSLVLLASTNTGKLYNVTQTITPVTAKPYTTVTVSTPKIIQTWSDSTTTTITDPNNQVTTTTQTGTAYLTDPSTSSTQTASSTGFANTIKIRNINPFLIDALSQKDGAWISPTASYYKTAGSMASGGVSAGYQWTVENNTFGVALGYGSAKTNGLINSSVQINNYDSTAYILSKQEDFWVKGSFGFGLGNYTGSTSIPSFALINSAKFKQYNYYADVTLYTAETFEGFRPLVGVTVNQSQIKNYNEVGSALLSTAPVMKSTVVNPYVGVRYDFDENVGIETRVTQTKDFKTVAGVRGVAKTEIDKGVFLNATVGFDKGKNYTGVVGTIGIKIDF